MKFIAFALLIATALFSWSPSAFAGPVLIVQVRTNLKPRVEFTKVRISVTGQEECGRNKRVEFLGVDSKRDWSRGVRVAEYSHLKKGDVRGKIALLDRRGSVVVERPFRLELSDGVRVMTMLLTRPPNCKGLCKPKKPPATLKGVTLVIGTGSDDLRGGKKDNVDVTVRFKDGRQQLFRNVNKGAKWKDHCASRVYLRFWKPVPRAQIKAVKLAATFAGGMGGDNWNVDSLVIQNESNGVVLYKRGGRPLFRLTASRKTFTANF